MPIKHGFKTSYATITTSGFNTTIVRPDQYQVRLHPTDPFSLVTLLNPSKTDESEQTFITSTSLNEVKLVPIRVGFSTRTDTVTSSHVLTLFKTVSNKDLIEDYSTKLESPSNQGIISPSESYSLLTTSYVTRQALSRRPFISSLVVNGKTLLSTVIETLLGEPITVTTTKTIAVKKSAIIGSKEGMAALVTALTTLITFQLTGADGGVTAVVTPVTLPLNIQATNARFKRSLLSQDNSREESGHLFSTSIPSFETTLYSSLEDNGQDNGQNYRQDNRQEPMTDIPFESSKESRVPEIYASFSLPASASAYHLAHKIILSMPS